MKIAHRRFLLSGLSLAVLCAAGIASADDHGNGQGGHDCKPLKIQMSKSGSTNPEVPDFAPNFLTISNVNTAPSTYDSKSADYHFGDTIRWKVPAENCKFVNARAFFTAKNNMNNGLQNNDGFGWAKGGATVAGMGGSIGPLAANQTKDIALSMSEAVARSGSISLAVQDDTAVMKMGVEINFCCPEDDHSHGAPGSFPRAGEGKGDDDHLGNAKGGKSGVIRSN